MSVRVACVIPVYNGERYLAEAIESVLKQTVPVQQLIVVDDGSTDGTADVARGFGDPVIYVHQDNAGPAVARNRGLSAVEADFVGFLDADDLWAPEKIERQLERLEGDPGLAYVVALVQNFWAEEQAVEREAFREHSRARPVPGFTTPALLARSEWIARTGGFDTSLGHADSADWFQRVEAMGGRGEVVKEVLVYRRLHGQNHSRRHAEQSRDEFLAMLKKRLDRSREKT